MSAFVKTALVANDFTGIEGGSSPGGRFSGMTIEAASTEILGLFGSGIVCVLNGEASMRGEIGHHVVVV
jgi:hypothetical protein